MQTVVRGPPAASSETLCRAVSIARVLELRALVAVRGTMAVAVEYVGIRTCARRDVRVDGARPGSQLDVPACSCSETFGRQRRNGCRQDDGGWGTHSTGSRKRSQVLARCIATMGQSAMVLVLMDGNERACEPASHDAGGKSGGARWLHATQVDSHHEETARPRRHAAVPFDRKLAPDSLAGSNAQGKLHQKQQFSFSGLSRGPSRGGAPHHSDVSTLQTSLMSGVPPTQHFESNVSMHFPPQIALLYPCISGAGSSHTSPRRDTCRSCRRRPGRGPGSRCPSCRTGRRRHLCSQNRFLPVQPWCVSASGP